MTRLALTSNLLALTLLGGACAGSDLPERSGPVVLDEARSSLPRELSPAVPPDDARRLVEGNSAFALALQGQLDEPRNSVSSPHSISAALAMAWAGARGETAAQMSAALRFDLPAERFHPAFDALDLALASRGRGAAGLDGKPFRLQVVNKIFALRGFSLQQGWLDTLAVHYGAGVGLLDFVGDPEGSTRTINAWIAQQTEDLIRDLLSPGDINALTRLVLTNAVYFNAAWLHPFDSDLTVDRPFKLLDGSLAQVPTMRQTEPLRYGAGPGFRAVELPYSGGELAMLVVVPDDPAAFRLDSAAGLDAVLASLRDATVSLALPKFRFESRFRLKEALSELGMPVAFSDEADFTGISTAEPLRIAQVIHQAVIAVSEQGTEAAAATAVIMEGRGAPSETVLLAVDRPFLFFIRDLQTGAIVFQGRLVDPR